MDQQLNNTKNKPQKKRKLQQPTHEEASSSDAVEYYDSLVNRLTEEEVDAVIAHYEHKYEFILNAQGCKLMGKKVKQPRKRGSVKPVWGPLVRKTDGYLQVTVAGIPKDGLRFKELFPKGKVQKVEWHRLCWRQHNNYAKCVKDKHICHRCGNRDCGTRDHLVQSTRDINEEQKHCRYLYYDNPSSGDRQLFLYCTHQPPCIPALEAWSLCVVPNQAIQNSVAFL